MAPNDNVGTADTIAPGEAEGLQKIADALGVKIVDAPVAAPKLHVQRRPFNPKEPPPLTITPYDMECAIAKAPTEEFLIAMLTTAVRMKHVPHHTKRRWSNVAEKRVQELKSAPVKFVRVSPSEVFPEVCDDRPAMKPADVVGAVNGNREWFCAENGVFKFVGPNGKPISIAEYFKTGTIQGFEPDVVIVDEVCSVCGGKEPCSHDFDKIAWPAPRPMNAHEAALAKEIFDPTVSDEEYFRRRCAHHGIK